MEVPMEPEDSPRRAKRRAFRGAFEDLTREIERIQSLDVPALIERWKALFDSAPSPLLSPVFMSRAIAYRIQERALGGLKPSTQKILDRLGGDGETHPNKLAPRRRASAGTVFIREWRGVRHRVTVLDNDVLYRNRRYKSLSEVARAITGTHWSGPLFFGLKKRGKEEEDGVR
jgi:Protein of unknown function (DUF2924)